MYLCHRTGRRHPEAPDRISAIMNELRNDDDLIGNWQLARPRKAVAEEVELVHDPKYVRQIELFCKKGGGILDSGDTIASRRTYETALFAVGGCLTAVDLVMNRECKNSFAAIRPPGHHAGKCSPMGFCVFNNVAISARYLIKKYSLRRILVLDFDDHHGNGTQDTFYGTDKVLYVSLHEDPKGFPGTGFLEETGKGVGLGYNVNIPFPFKTSDDMYSRAISEIVVPIADQYSPQFVLISAGFDAHFSDPVGSLSLSSRYIDSLYRTAIQLADCCNGRLCAVLEGGYNTRTLGKLVKQTVSTLAEGKYRFYDNPPPIRRKVAKEGEDILKQVRRTQKVFWRLD